MLHILLHSGVPREVVWTISITYTEKAVSFVQGLDRATNGVITTVVVLHGDDLALFPFVIAIDYGRDSQTVNCKINSKVWHNMFKEL